MTQMFYFSNNFMLFSFLLSDTVCKLYFDLEFEYKVNENKNGARMTEIYMKVNFLILFLVRKSVWIYHVRKYLECVMLFVTAESFCCLLSSSCFVLW